MTDSKYFTTEVRKKISESKKGENHPLFGKGHSEETKRKMSETKKGKYDGEKNPFFGRKHSQETIEKIRKAKSGSNNPFYGKKNPIFEEYLKSTKGEKHHSWKGDNIGYFGLHDRIKKQLPKTELCMVCAKVPPYDLANVSGKYLTDLSDWLWLCRKCHMNLDGRLFNKRRELK